MKKWALGIAATSAGVAAVLASVEGSAARELGVSNQYQPGLLIGIASGANPPPVGIYATQRAAVYDANIVDGGGQKTGSTLHANATSTQISFSPGWTILGASYMAFITQPVVDVTTKINGVTTRISGFADTVWSPINLSWMVGPGIFVGAGFSFYGPNGTIEGANKTSGIAAPFWTFEPGFGFSYLRDGYNLSAHVAFDINTANPETNFTSGAQMFVDWTTTKKFGNWEFGPVGYYAAQISSDKDPDGVYAYLASLNIPGSNPYSKPRALALGALAAYDWGPVKATVYGLRDVYARDTTQGWALWAHLSFRLWGENMPSAPRPMH